MSNSDAPQEVISEHRRFEHAVEDRRNQFAYLLTGRLRSVSPYNLRRLKKELSQFNAHTGRWKS